MVFGISEGNAVGLTLSMEYTKLIKWWLEVVYNMHRYMRSHTGVMISMGKGGGGILHNKNKAEYEELN